MNYTFVGPGRCADREGQTPQRFDKAVLSQPHGCTNCVVVLNSDECTPPLALNVAPFNPHLSVLWGSNFPGEFFRTGMVGERVTVVVVVDKDADVVEQVLVKQLR